LHAATEAWSALGCPYEAAEALADGDSDVDLRAALGEFDRLGATAQRRRVARRLRELGIRTIPRGPQRSTIDNPDGLTARQAEILDWLSRGHTNQQIAARLHLSVRTVEHHVAAILRKKRSANRRDLYQR
jgi:DNA-binding NarL/FixJ family response regulator